MKSLASIFPNASASTLAVNTHLRPKTSVQDDVASAKGKRGVMNNTESEFAMMLEAQKRTGEILRYEFHGMSLRWGVDEKTGDSMRYTPDFVVVVDGYLHCGKPKSWIVKLIEVKGPHIHYRQQAMARFK